MNKKMLIGLLGVLLLPVLAVAQEGPIYEQMKANVTQEVTNNIFNSTTYWDELANKNQQMTQWFMRKLYEQTGDHHIHNMKYYPQGVEVTVKSKSYYFLDYNENFSQAVVVYLSPAENRISVSNVEGEILFLFQRADWTRDYLVTLNFPCESGKKEEVYAFGNREI